MTVHYETLQPAALYADAFAVDSPQLLGEREMWPRMAGVFVRARAAASELEAPELSRELVAGQWGLVPRWVKSASDAKLRSPKLATARSETVSTSKNFFDAWQAGQRCIVPMNAFFVDDWRSGQAVPTRIARVDGKPMGVAGLWEDWTSKSGERILSFSLLTVNANNHALLHRYEQPGSEKRMPVILNEGSYDAWLGVRAEKAREFMRAYAANWLLANPVEARRSPKMQAPQPQPTTRP